LAVLSLGACAQAPSGDRQDVPTYGDAGVYPPGAGDGATVYPPSPGNGDGELSGNGQPTTGQPQTGGNNVEVTSGDASAGVDLNSIGGFLGNLGGSVSDAGTPDVGDGGMCQNLVCFDVFDCYILHPSEATTCGFTACEAFICK
jgi:hypothetical protein